MHVLIQVGASHKMFPQLTLFTHSTPKNADFLYDFLDTRYKNVHHSEESLHTNFQSPIIKAWLHWVPTWFHCKHRSYYQYIWLNSTMQLQVNSGWYMKTEPFAHQIHTDTPTMPPPMCSQVICVYFRMFMRSVYIQPNHHIHRVRVVHLHVHHLCDVRRATCDVRIAMGSWIVHKLIPWLG